MYKVHQVLNILPQLWWKWYASLTSKIKLILRCTLVTLLSCSLFVSFPSPNWFSRDNPALVLCFTKFQTLSFQSCGKGLKSFLCDFEDASWCTVSQYRKILSLLLLLTLQIIFITVALPNLFFIFFTVVKEFVVHATTDGVYLYHFKSRWNYVRRHAVT